ncbi:MAG: hypothetical protein ACRC5A_03395 [Enterobacteriaceae bacterium]
MRENKQEALLSLMDSNEYYDESWVVRVGKESVQLIRVINGNIDATYAPVSRRKANVYLAAIVNDLQPPRNLVKASKADTVAATTADANWLNDTMKEISSSLNAEES